MPHTTRINVTPGATQKETARRIRDALRDADHRPFIEKDGYLWNDGVTRTDLRHDVHVVLGDNETGLTFSRLLDGETTGWATTCTNLEKGWYSQTGNGVMFMVDRATGEFIDNEAKVWNLIALLVRRAAANDRKIAKRALEAATV